MTAGGRDMAGRRDSVHRRLTQGSRHITRAWTSKTLNFRDTCLIHFTGTGFPGKQRVFQGCLGSVREREALFGLGTLVGDVLLINTKCIHRRRALLAKFV